jgi:transcription termination/antitermination protein NusA
MALVYDLALIQHMNLFEKLSGAKLKDCIVSEGEILFIVEPNEMAKAIGKHGFTVKKLENAFKKKVKIVEFSPEVKSFIKNLVTPLKIKDVLEEEKVFTMIPQDVRTRGLLIGRNASILRANEAVIKRHFEINELRVS